MLKLIICGIIITLYLTDYANRHLKKAKGRNGQNTEYHKKDVNNVNLFCG